MSHDVLAFPRRRLVSAGGRSTYPAGITSTPMAVDAANAVRAVSRPRRGNPISELGTGILLRPSEL
jgi:hypothetical protein